LKEIDSVRKVIIIEKSSGKKMTMNWPNCIVSEETIDRMSQGGVVEVVLEKGIVTKVTYLKS